MCQLRLTCAVLARSHTHFWFPLVLSLLNSFFLPFFHPINKSLPVLPPPKHPHHIKGRRSLAPGSTNPFCTRCLKRSRKEKKSKKRDVFMSTWHPGRGWHSTTRPRATFCLGTRAQELAPTGASPLQGRALPLPLALSIPRSTAPGPECHRSQGRCKTPLASTGMLRGRRGRRLGLCFCVAAALQ